MEPNAAIDKQAILGVLQEADNEEIGMV